MLNLGHSQITLPQVVGEGSYRGVEEAQHVILISLEAFQQVARRGANYTARAGIPSNGSRADVTPRLSSATL